MASKLDPLLDFPFHHVFGRADLAEQDAMGRPEERKVVLDGITIATIQAVRPGISPQITTMDGKTIGPSFDPDVLRRRVVSQLFDGDERALQRAVVI